MFFNKGFIYHFSFSNSFLKAWQLRKLYGVRGFQDFSSLNKSKRDPCKSYKEEQKTNQNKCKPPKDESKQYCEPLKASNETRACELPKIEIEGPYSFEKILETPYLIRIWGPKHTQILKSYIPSVIIYLTAGLIFTIYVTDWKVIVSKIPYYNGKFEETAEEEEQND